MARGKAFLSPRIRPYHLQCTTSPPITEVLENGTSMVYIYLYFFDFRAGLRRPVQKQIGH